MLFFVAARHLVRRPFSRFEVGKWRIALLSERMDIRKSFLDTAVPSTRSLDKLSTAWCLQVSLQRLGRSIKDLAKGQRRA